LGRGNQPSQGAQRAWPTVGVVIATTAGQEAHEWSQLESGVFTHEVISGLCLITPGWEELHTETTRVTFRPLTARDIAAYVASAEWEGRAGAYAIQSAAAAWISHIDGSYSGIMGLPLYETAQLLRQARVRF